MLFCLRTGAALDVAMGPYRGKKTGENSLLQLLIGLLFPGDILLADRYYASFGNIHRACQGGYDVVMRAHHKRKIDPASRFQAGLLRSNRGLPQTETSAGLDVPERVS